MPAVSIIVPCFNPGAFFPLTIRSVEEQSLSDWEILCVDDGCTDGTDLFLASKAGPKLKVLTHPGRRNQGQAASTNLAVRNASGRYLAFLDADDLWYPEKLARQVEFLEKNPEVGGVFCNGRVVDENGRRRYRLVDPDDVNLTPQHLLVNCFIRTPTTVMVRAEVLRQAGAFSLVAPTDHDMWLRIAEISRWGFLDENLVGYRKHGDQISLKRRQWEEGFAVLAAAQNRFPYPKSAVRARRATLHYRLGECDLANGRYVSGAFQWLVAGLSDPTKIAPSLKRIAARRLPLPLSYHRRQALPS